MLDKDNNPETLLCIIRHGETDWNSSGRLQGCEDIELNDLGRKQGLEVAEYFKKRQWDMIVSSPLKRAFETAQIIASALGISPVVIMEDLRERDYGQASGLLPDERHRRFPDGVIPGQEEFEHLRSRAIKAMEKLVEEYNGKKIIVVSHGAFTNSVLYTVSGGEFGSFKTRLKNGCLNLLEYKEGKWKVLYYNKTINEF